ncbi:hypothetical protein HanRHA438_Chr11g0514851 [Helianthus annuus]|nr:hypothetical protein HanIR_Chr11g0540661 [Helianthus annuus]KAJ0871645.1 hypothetical protein HanRHA438_Chr11g0514851 [Helianthus annuus]
MMALYKVINGFRRPNLSQKKFSENATSRPYINRGCILCGTKYEFGCTIKPGANV